MNKKPLHGLRVLNTRPAEQAKTLSCAIEAAGGIAIECPALAIQPTEKTWIDALPDLATIDQAIFISANAVHYCFKTLAERQLLWPTTIQTIAIGHATAQTLTHYKVRVDCVPLEASSEPLLALSAMQKVKEKRILLFKGEGGRTLITEMLQTRGAQLFSFAVYKRLMPANAPRNFQAIWQDNAVDIILFTSQQAMNNVFTCFGKKAHTWLCNKPCVVISERLANSAFLLGIHTVIISKPETIITTLQQFNQGLIHGQ